jgi:colanic acid/amylovoran biosynthesis glycosyltransferase
MMRLLPSAGCVLEEKPLLVILPSVVAARSADDWVLDEKAISGLHLYQRLWPGRIRGVFREGDRSTLNFGRPYALDQFPFEIRVVPPKERVPDALISDASIVLASGDNWMDLPIADQGLRLGVPVCFVIEYILETRLQILALSDASLLSKIKSFLWNLRTERKRRQAFLRSSAIQSNGVPAAQSYRDITSNLLTFFDSRLSEVQMATEEEIIAKQQRIMRGEPLRVAFTGRLEKLKGSDHLLAIAALLEQSDLAFTLDIYGRGSLATEMRATLGCANEGLRKRVRIHEPIDFSSELVPLLRKEVDLFLCCHQQSDPSCTYLETLGCAVPILGYENRALKGLLNLADVGWTTPSNSTMGLVRKIIDLDKNRFELMNKIRNARNFARMHSFESSFEKRVGQLWQLARRENFSDGH